MVAVGFTRRDKGYSKRSNRMYFGALIVMAFVAFGAGICAATSEKNIAVAYGAVMVIGGTAGQILLAASRKNGQPLIGAYKTVDVVVPGKPGGGPTVVPIPIGDDELRDTLHVVAWVLVGSGAICALVGVFI